MLDRARHGFDDLSCGGGSGGHNSLASLGRGGETDGGNGRRRCNSGRSGTREVWADTAGSGVLDGKEDLVYCLGVSAYLQQIQNQNLAYERLATVSKADLDGTVCSNLERGTGEHAEGRGFVSASSTTGA